MNGGEYGGELMANSVLSMKYQPKGQIDPMIVLNQAFLNTEARGSSTTCILTLTGNMLHAANIGDSGFVLDNPSLAQLKVSVIPGYTVVRGTDGLFDNLNGYKIEALVNRGIDEAHMPKEVACSIAELALGTSLDRYALSPFAKAAWEAGLDFIGGKIDIITVVVAYIVSMDLA
ncbi:hypothetical protein Acr_12g0007210 [Actinidia rufa]|uniref:Protein phosphatase n=1 Tax=Actinidia rufa TaxID=165716 RepID=A0A7J0FHK3_9ERIC|nr:hypothetical protein Acr_12g0007190 [Actinidia rufa]GFY98180.1 hypothetical protein Acr_12g0007210 [Actinidia rufa]